MIYFSKKTLVILLILSLFFHGYQLFLLKKEEAISNKIDGDFKASISRIASPLNDKDINKYIIAIEHASKANALSKYTSYAKDDSFVIGYTADLINSFRNLYINKKDIKNSTEIINLISHLSKNPNDKETASHLLLLLNSNY